MRSIRCMTGSSPSNSRSRTLSMRPSRSTNTSSGPFTMTSVTIGSFSRDSIGPNPTTSSETSFTMRESSRCGRSAPRSREELERLLAHPHPALGRRRAREPARVDPHAELVAHVASQCPQGIPRVHGATSPAVALTRHLGRRPEHEATVLPNGRCRARSGNDATGGCRDPAVGARSRRTAPPRRPRCPNTRSTSAGTTSERAARLTTNRTRSASTSGASRASRRVDARNDITSSARTSTITSAVVETPPRAGIQRCGRVHDHDVDARPRDLDHAPQRRLVHRRTIAWRHHHAEPCRMRPRRGVELLRGQLGDDPRELVEGMDAVGSLGDAERRGDIVPPGVDVQQDARAVRLRDGLGEMGRDERATGAASRRVDRDHDRATLEGSSCDGERAHARQQLVAFDRPDGEGGDAGRDGRPERRNRFPAGDRDAGRALRHERSKPRLRKNEVGLEMTSGGLDLLRVADGRQDLRDAASIEEMQQLIEHLGRVERQHHAGDRFHASVLHLSSRHVVHAERHLSGSARG